MGKDGRISREMRFTTASNQDQKSGFQENKGCRSRNTTEKKENESNEQRRRRSRSQYCNSSSNRDLDNLRRQKKDIEGLYSNLASTDMPKNKRCNQNSRTQLKDNFVSRSNSSRQAQFPFNGYETKSFLEKNAKNDSNSVKNSKSLENEENQTRNYQRPKNTMTHHSSKEGLQKQINQNKIKNRVFQNSENSGTSSIRLRSTSADCHNRRSQMKQSEISQTRSQNDSSESKFRRSRSSSSSRQEGANSSLNCVHCPDCDRIFPRYPLSIVVAINVGSGGGWWFVMHIKGL